MRRAPLQNSRCTVSLLDEIAKEKVAKTKWPRALVQQEAWPKAATKKEEEARREAVLSVRSRINTLVAKEAVARKVDAIARSAAFLADAGAVSTPAADSGGPGRHRLTSEERHSEPPTKPPQDGARLERPPPGRGRREVERLGPN